MKFQKKIEVAKAMADSDLKLSTLETLALQAVPHSSTQKALQSEINRLRKKGYKIPIPEKYQTKKSASNEKFEVSIVGSKSAPVIYDDKTQAEKAKRNAELLGFEMIIKKVEPQKEIKNMAEKKEPKETPLRAGKAGISKKQPKTANKPTPKTTPAQSKKAAEKPVAKRSEPKPVAPRKVPKTATPKPTSANKSGKDKLLIHSDKDEMNVGGEKPIILNAKNATPKRAPKVLRKVAKTGGYTAWDDIKRNGKTFATEKEAKDYAEEVHKKTGKIVPISPTDRQVTHTFKAEEEKKKK